MNDIERDIHRFIAEVLLDGEGSDLELDTPLLEYRVIDSLNVEELLVYVNENFGVSIDEHPPSSWSSIRKLAALVQRRMHGDAVPAGLDANGDRGPTSA